MDKLIILREAFYTFFYDSEDEDNDEDEDFQNKVKKSDNSGKHAIQRFSNKTFKQHFRMNPDVFELVLKDIHSHLAQGYGPGRHPLRIDKQLMITLWYLGNPECLRSISDRFGVCVSTSWRIISSVGDALIKSNATKKFIKWPTPEEAAKTSKHYFSKYKFKGIIGSIDGSHIPIRAPTHSHNSYINSKGVHSVLLQGVCNENMEFIYCYTGECGSIDKASLLAKSGLEIKLDSGRFSITAGQHLLGDSQYPIKKWLIPPFRDNGQLMDEQKIFNAVHSKCRLVIKRAFGLLKGRFRRLVYIDSLRPTAIVRFIIISCILHNICLQNQDVAEEFMVNETEKEDENEEEDAERTATKSATAKRKRLMNSLF